MIGWFDMREVDAFALQIVDEVVARFPPEAAGLPEQKIVDRIRRMNDAVSGRVGDFARGRRLNLFKRARLSNQVKWAMKQKGYPDRFVDAFTSELTTLVSVIK